MVNIKNIIRLDTKEFMNLSTVEDSAERLFLFLRVLEMQNLYPKSKIAGGEPMLSNGTSTQV